MQFDVEELYERAVRGLHERFGLAPGLAVVLDHVPAAVQTTPLLYSVLDGLERDVRGTMVEWTFRTTHRLCLAWQDPAEAERLLRRFAVTIPEAVDVDPRLGGRAKNAFVEAGDAGWVEIGGTECRSLDFTSVVTVMAEYRGVRRTG